MWEKIARRRTISDVDLLNCVCKEVIDSKTEKKGKLSGCELGRIGPGELERCLDSRFTNVFANVLDALQVRGLWNDEQLSFRFDNKILGVFH